MIVGVTILVFFLMSLSPVDQAYSVLGENASEAQVQQYRDEHGLNDPVVVQYGNFMAGLVKGNLGTYGASNASVAERIATALPVTLQLTFFGLIIAVIIAVVLGVVSALYRDRWPDQIIRVLSIASIATPSFWLAVLMILLFSSTLHVLPASGALPAFGDDPAGWFARMALPAVALAVPLIGQLTRVIRTSMVEELDRDYVRTALSRPSPSISGNGRLSCLDLRLSRRREVQDLIDVRARRRCLRRGRPDSFIGRHRARRRRHGRHRGVRRGVLHARLPKNVEKTTAITVIIKSGFKTDHTTPKTERRTRWPSPHR